MAELSVLWIGAHPDDCEFLCAGTLIHLSGKGCEIHIATMTPGDCGSMEYSAEEISRIRMDEARASAEKIGAEYHCLGEKDLLVLHTKSALLKTTELIRRVQPQIVFTQSPHDYMVDHESTSSLARTACFTAPMPNFATDIFPSAHRIAGIPHLYYADSVGFTDILGDRITPTIYVNITDTIGLKEEMLASHDSQRSWLKAQHGVDAYIDEMKRMAKERGREAGVPFAEGFRQHLGHAYPTNNILKELLGNLVIERNTQAS